MDISIVALIASVVSICLAFFAIWQANHHRDKSDKLNRDTTEKLARIEGFATSTKEDAFAEIKRWGDFARAGGKASEEAENAKEEEMRKLKDEIQATTSAEINKVLQTVEAKLSSSGETSTISEIKKEFEDLKEDIVKIQEKGLKEIERLKSEKKLMRYWPSLPREQKNLLAKAAKNPHLCAKDLERAGMRMGSELFNFISRVLDQGFIREFYRQADDLYIMTVTPMFREFLEIIEKDEME